MATDINPKAVDAAQRTASQNSVEVEVHQTSFVESIYGDVAGKVDVCHACIHARTHALISPHALLGLCFSSLRTLLRKTTETEPEIETAYPSCVHNT